MRTKRKWRQQRFLVFLCVFSFFFFVKASSPLTKVFTQEKKRKAIFPASFEIHYSFFFSGGEEKEMKVSVTSRQAGQGDLCKIKDVNQFISREIWSGFCLLLYAMEFRKIEIELQTKANNKFFTPPYTYTPICFSWPCMRVLSKNE